MIINCNIEGNDRKRLVQLLGDTLSEKPVYQKAPTYAYKVGEYTVDRDGRINTDADDEAKLTISIPRDKLPGDALARLKMIVSNKEALFKRALQTDSLPIEVSDEAVSFPWFTPTDIEGEATAYAQFIANLCKMAVEQTRVLDKPYDGDNDRFAMRIFMVRLGMKGAQFALARKLMMQHLSGNSGWRFGAPPKKAEKAAVPIEELNIPIVPIGESGIRVAADEAPADPVVSVEKTLPEDQSKHDEEEST